MCLLPGLHQKPQSPVAWAALHAGAEDCWKGLPPDGIAIAAGDKRCHEYIILDARNEYKIIDAVSIMQFLHAPGGTFVQAGLHLQFWVGLAGQQMQGELIPWIEES